MRNLTLWRANNVPLIEADFSSLGESSGVTCLAVDLDQNALFAATEGGVAASDAEARIFIWKLPQDDQVSNIGFNAEVRITKVRIT